MNITASNLQPELRLPGEGTYATRAWLLCTLYGCNLYWFLYKFQCFILQGETADDD